GFVDRDVRHEARGRGAVPVVLARLEVHAIAGADLLDRAALALAAADALGDEDRLAERVRVPVGAGARGEVHERRRRAGGRLGRGDRVDVDAAGEPVAGAEVGVDRTARDLHGLHVSTASSSSAATALRRYRCTG